MLKLRVLEILKEQQRTKYWLYNVNFLIFSHSNSIYITKSEMTSNPCPNTHFIFPSETS